MTSSLIFKPLGEVARPDRASKSSRLRAAGEYGGMKLPDLEALKAFETVGPNGRAVSDINGKAASIECYLDTSYKRREAPIVRWTAFNRDTGVYQGEIEGKTGIVKSFLKLRRVPHNYDLVGIEACLDELVSQCIMIAERLNKSDLKK